MVSGIIRRSRQTIRCEVDTRRGPGRTALRVEHISLRDCEEPDKNSYLKINQIKRI